LKWFKLFYLLILFIPFGVQCAEAQPDILISSQYIVYPVTLDGKITDGQEWSEAIPVEFQLGLHLGTVPPFLNTKIWSLNDDECLYLLYRIEWPAIDDDARDQASIAYFWPKWDPVTGWDYSDTSAVCRDGAPIDQYGWDESQWYHDIFASPQGEISVEGAGTHDGTYYWFEFRKKLNSGDGYDWNLKPCRDYGLKDGSDDGGGDLLVGFWDQSELQSYEKYVRLHASAMIIIDKSIVSDDRCDIGSNQTVGYHAKWAHNDSDAVNGLLYVEDEYGAGHRTELITDENGWVYFEEGHYEVGKKTWKVVGVDCNQVTLFNQTAPSPSIIWDRVSFQSNSEKLRLDVGTEETNILVYEYDKTPFEGSVNFNDTFKSEVGKYGYKIVSISDSLYGLSTFTSDEVSIIFDRVNIILMPEDLRIDVGQPISYSWTGEYEYDMLEFKGTINVNDTLATEATGRYPLEVNSISDQEYGLTSFTQNEVYYIWDQVIIKIALSDERCDVGQEPDVSYTAYYEYDSQPFIGDVHVSKPVFSAEVGDHNYSVENIEDTQYGLTRFVSEDALCVWDRIEVTEGGVSNRESTVKNSETVWFKAEYEYDSETFDDSKGILYLNNEPMKWSSSNHRWEKEYGSDKPQILTFEITEVKDNKYELTTYYDNVGSLSIEWKQRGIPGFPIQSILLGLALVLFILYKKK